MRSRQGDPVRRCVKASVNLVASSTSSKDVRDPRVGHPPVEVGDQVSGPVRHSGGRFGGRRSAPRFSTARP